MRDAGDHAFQDAAVARAGFGIVETPEAQRIQHRDRPRAHGENVAQDAADAGGRALKRLDEAGMVVRFDLERDRNAVADIDDAGVFARALQHVFAVRGKLLQMNARALVGAMLAPHHAENAEFGLGGFAAQQAHDLVVFRFGELVCAITSGVIVLMMWRRKGAHVGKRTQRPVSKIVRPSVAPIRGSAARSGCGIMPITLRPSLRIPAMFRCEPFGLSR